MGNAKPYPFIFFGRTGYRSIFRAGQTGYTIVRMIGFKKARLSFFGDSLRLCLVGKGISRQKGRNVSRLLHSR